MLGYNGANNTGAEALLLADIEDMRAVLGPEATINIPSLNPANLRRYVPEGPRQRIPFLPTIFFATLRRLVRENDLIFLVEGSTYMDTWTSALLWAYLWATRCADNMDKPCAAYAVDAGEMHSALNRRLVRSEASKTDLIITRAKAAAERMRQWGVTAPLEVTADNAFTFVPDAQDRGLLRKEWPEAGSSVVGYGHGGLSPVARGDAPLGPARGLLQVALLLFALPGAPAGQRGPGAGLCGPGRQAGRKAWQIGGSHLHGAARRGDRPTGTSAHGSRRKARASFPRASTTPPR